MTGVIEPTRRIAVLDGHLLSDRAVRRVAAAARALVLITTDALSDATERFRELAPDVEILDGGVARGDVREAIVRAAEAGCVMIAVPEPHRARAFLISAVAGAVDARDRGHRTVAVLVLRDREVPGDVAVFSRSGQASGWGLAFALEIAMRRGVNVARILPRAGLYVRRAAAVAHRAEVEAAAFGVRVRYRRVQRPLETVLRGQFTLAIHSVLDVMGRRGTEDGTGAALRLQRDANVDSVLWLLRFFRGDVMLVGDDVRLREGRNRDAIIAT